MGRSSWRRCYPNEAEVPLPYQHPQLKLRLGQVASLPAGALSGPQSVCSGRLSCHWMCQRADVRRMLVLPHQTRLVDSVCRFVLKKESNAEGAEGDTSARQRLFNRIGTGFARGTVRKLPNPMHLQVKPRSVRRGGTYCRHEGKKDMHDVKTHEINKAGATNGGHPIQPELHKTGPTHRTSVMT
jgi:hypothetical protein